jgi:prepilin-type N-terminal cleavage/methylation domain-containing protein
MLLPHKRYGFTFLELVIAITVLAVVAVALLPRLFDPGKVRLDLALEKLSADMKYAREFAMNRNCRAGLTFSPSTDTYTVYEDSSGSWAIARDPTTREDFVVALNQGRYKGVVIASAVFDGGSLVWFNSLGEPHSASSAPLAATGSAMLGYAGGTEQYSVNVTPTTGRIYVSR